MERGAPQARRDLQVGGTRRHGQFCQPIEICGVNSSNDHNHKISHITTTVLLLLITIMVLTNVQSGFCLPTRIESFHHVQYDCSRITSFGTKFVSLHQSRKLSILLRTSFEVLQRMRRRLSLSLAHSCIGTVRERAAFR
mmetsp:Transcript_9521/g.28383  ORF Transcript_9521/g.28383 Transcript_9521/m.28383 type:complete len:139 (-) Transcript_9521:1049-1465(-)